MSGGACEAGPACTPIDPRCGEAVGEAARRVSKRRFARIVISWSRRMMPRMPPPPPFRVTGKPWCVVVRSSFTRVATCNGRARQARAHSQRVSEAR